MERVICDRDGFKSDDRLSFCNRSDPLRVSRRVRPSKPESKTEISLVNGFLKFKLDLSLIHATKPFMRLGICIEIKSQWDALAF